MSIELIWGIFWVSLFIITGCIIAAVGEAILKKKGLKIRRKEQN